MNYRIRIIAGELGGRKIEVKLDPKLRPMSDRARGALFNILVNDIPERPFYDVFAGSGAVGLEALSRGAKLATFIEKDGLSVQAILKHAKMFGVNDRTRVLQVDAYRWIEKGSFPQEPTNYFLGPPYTAIADHLESIQWMVTTLKSKVSPGSVVVLQTDDDYHPKLLPDNQAWDVRRYGRNQLAFWRHVEADATVRPGDGEATA
jgi:16S rRNA (guanine966-N2)-methyltransferase